MKKFTVSAVALAISAIAGASVVRKDVDYQIFRNFGENKGQFQVGRTNIPVYNKDNQLLGYAFPENIPMPDFSAVDSENHLSGLISYQYVASVKHNSNAHFDGLTFGFNRDNSGYTNTRYKMVDRNDHSTLDYNIPRLHKMVFEVEPAELPDTLESEDIFNGRFSAFARAGSGTQAVQEGRNVTVIANAYQYRTGGTPLKMSNAVGDMVTTVTGNVEKDSTSYGPLVSYAAKGDSGSPLFGYDAKLGRWVLVGNVAQYYGYGTVRNNYMLTRNNFLQQVQQDDMQLFNVKSAKPLRWADNGQSGETVLSSELNRATVKVKKGSNLNNGKNLIFKGNQVNIELQNNIDQGAGGLYFMTSGTVSAVNNSITHVGSGVYVDEGETVTWKVKNPSSDRLVKVGKGTLVVQGTGENSGHLGLGEGKVVLNQQADSSGKKKAFSSISIASGRGTLVLGQNQLSTMDDVRFGYRGGKVDLNGANMSLSKIHHVDDGVAIINGNKAQASTLRFKNSRSETYLGDLGTMPAVLDSRYKPSFDVPAVDISDFANNDGVLNFEHNPTTQDQVLALTGNVNIKGDFNSQGGVLSISGAPTVYADEYRNGGRFAVTHDDDYQNRIFNANSLNVGSNADVRVGRNISSFNANMSVQGRLQLGDTAEHNTEIGNTIPVTQAEGNLSIGRVGQVTLGKVALSGKVTGEDSSRLSLSKDSTLILTGDSQIGHLVMTDGAKVNLNPDHQFDRFNTFTILNSLSGNGKFRFSTDLKGLVANKLILRDKVSGTHKIQIEDSGREPTNVLSEVQLLEIRNPNQNYHFELDKGYVDAGAYRYVLKDNGKLSAENKNAKPKETGLENVDPNYKQPDFGKLNPNFKNLTLMEQIRAVYKANNNRTLTTSELLSALRGQGVNISTTLAPSASLPLYYNLDKLTPEQLKELESNGVDLSQIDPDTLKDHTPIPKELKEVLLYDKETAETEGVVLNKEIENTHNSKEENILNPDQPSVTVPDVIVQKDKMSKYSNAVVDSATSNAFNFIQVNNLALHRLINPLENLWVDYRYQRFNSESDLYRNNQHATNTVQLGGLYPVTHQFSFGGLFTELRDKGDMADLTSSKNRIRLAEMVGKYTFDNGVFVYGRSGMGKSKTDFSIDGQQSNIRQSLWKAGAGVGLNAKIKDFTFTPFVEAMRYNIKGQSADVNGAKVQFADWKGTVFSSGLNAAYDIHLDHNLTLQPQAAVVYHSGLKESKVKVNQASFRSEVKSGVESQVGLNLISPIFKFGISGSYIKSEGFKSNKGLNTSLEILF